MNLAAHYAIRRAMTPHPEHRSEHLLTRSAVSLGDVSLRPRAVSLTLYSTHCITSHGHPYSLAWLESASGLVFRVAHVDRTESFTLVTALAQRDRESRLRRPLGHILSDVPRSETGPRTLVVSFSLWYQKRTVWNVQCWDPKSDTDIETSPQFAGE